MMTTSQMYWIVTLDSIVIASFILTVIFFVAMLFSIGLRSDDIVGTWAPVTSAVLALLCLAVNVFTPSTKQMAAILIIPRIANSEKVQQAGNKLYDLAVEWMDELKPNRNNNKGTDK